MGENSKFDASSGWFAKDVKTVTDETPAAEKFKERIRLVEDARELKEPKRIPICTMFGALPYNLEGSSYRTAMYDYPAATEVLPKFSNEWTGL